MATKSFRRYKNRVVTRLETCRTQILDALRRSPKDLAWKVRWRMKHDHNPLFVKIQDKYAVKAFARERGIRTAELFYVTEQPESIPFDTLPENYFIRANHGCGWNILCKNSVLYYYKSGEDLGNRDMSKYVITQEECIQSCNTWLNSIYSKSQWAYQHIKPCIMVEELLLPRVGDVLIDYRCFSFDGKVIAINEDSPLHNMVEGVFVDANWQPFDIPKHIEKPPVPFPDKPETLDEIVAAAETLGQGIDFVRIDIYDTTRGITLGEMTIYPWGGELNTPTTDAEFNQWLGEHWKLPAHR